MPKQLLAAMMLLTFSAFAHASVWDTDVKDDLFSDTGKQAMLRGFNGQQITFLAECNSKSFSYHLLFQQKAMADEAQNAYGGMITYAIKIDGAAPHVENSVLLRRNSNYLHTGQNRDKPTEDDLALLREIGAAKSQVVLGLDSGSQQFNNTLSASGSTAAVQKFLSACGYK